MIGIIVALTSSASWALATVIFERLGKVIPSAGITFIKGVFSIIVMCILVLLIGDFSLVSAHDALVLTLSGILGIAIGDTMFFSSLRDLGAKVQVLLFMLGQIFTLLLSFMLLGEILTLGEYIGAIILISGVILVTWGKQDDHPNKLRGVMYGLLSIFCFSISTIMIKLTDNDIDVISASFYRMFAGTIIMLFVGTTTRKIKIWVSPLRTPRTLILFIFNVFVITLGGFTLSLYAIKHIGVSIASLLSTTEPVFVLVFAFIVNKEKACVREILGAIVTIFGLIIIMLHGSNC